MPRKPRGKGNRITELIHEEDADSIDTGSVVSYSSSARWEAGSDDGFDGQEDAQYDQNEEAQDVGSAFNEKMEEAMDRVTDKSAMTRIHAIELLSKNFISK